MCDIYEKYNSLKSQVENFDNGVNGNEQQISNSKLDVVVLSVLVVLQISIFISSLYLWGFSVYDAVNVPVSGIFKRILYVFLAVLVTPVYLAMRIRELKN